MRRNARRAVRRVVGCLLLTLTPHGAAAGAPALLDYRDQQYQFAFQYPPDWTLDTTVKRGSGGEVRAVVRLPNTSIRAMASIGQVGKSISKAQLQASPHRDTLVQALMQLSIKEVYEQISHQIHADKMLVGDQQILASDLGVKFYISTVHIIGKTKIIIAGMHFVPYDKPYMVTFTMISPFSVGAAAHQDAISRVFNSFHLLPPQS